MSNASHGGVDHLFEFTRRGEDHTCVVRVILSDRAIQTIEATCPTKHAARLIAAFKACFAVKCDKDYSAAQMQQEQDAPAPSEEGVEASRESKLYPVLSASNSCWICGPRPVNVYSKKGNESRGDRYIKCTVDVFI